MFRLLLYLSVASMAFGQAASDTRRPGSIRGSVASILGEPLRKAQVTLRQGGGSGRSSQTRTFETGHGGTFIFDNLQPGSYLLSAQRNGYVRAEYGGKAGVRMPASAITVAPGQELTGIHIRLTPHAVVTGKVVDEDGDPVAFTSVQALRERYVRGKRQLSQTNASATNDIGEYRIAGLHPGRYYLMVSSRRMFDSSARAAAGVPETSYPSVYYPGVAEPEQAAPLTLASGQEMRGIDFQIRKMPAFRVRGRVLDEAGKPVTRAAIMALSGGSSSPTSRVGGAVRGPDGAFEIGGLTPGSYMLMVNRMEGEARGTAQVPITLGNGDIDDVVLQLSRPFEISGTLRLPAEANVPLAGVRVALEPAGTWAFPAESKAVADGKFTIGRVAPGKYRIVVTGLPESTYLKSVTAGGQDITAGAQINSAARDIEIQLGAKPGEVSGVVAGAEDKPIPNALVVLAPEASKRDQYWLFRLAAADNAGAFSIRGIAPGRYTVFAFTDVEDGIWHSPEFLKSVESRGTTVTLEEGSRETLTLKSAQ